MPVVAIFGAGDIGGALASTLASRDLVREIRVIDDAAGVAAGKALDILQAGPIEASSTRVIATADERAAAQAAVIVLADAVGQPPAEIKGETGLALIRRLHELAPDVPIVCAGPSQAWLIEHAIDELGVSPARIAGSAPLALTSAIRALVALDASSSPTNVSLLAIGLPPSQVVVPWQSAAVQGLPLDGLLSAAALRRLEQQIPYLWPPGPYALASAAARFVEAFAFGAREILCGFLSPPDARPAAVRMGPLRITASQGVSPCPLAGLDSRQRLALDSLQR